MTLLSMGLGNTLLVQYVPTSRPGRSGSLDCSCYRPRTALDINVIGLQHFPELVAKRAVPWTQFAAALSPCARKCPSPGQQICKVKFSPTSTTMICLFVVIVVFGTATQTRPITNDFVFVVIMVVYKILRYYARSDGLDESVLTLSLPSDQFQISPAASPEILHNTLWRIWLFIAYTGEKWSYYQFSPDLLYISL